MSISSDGFHSDYSMDTAVSTHYLPYIIYTMVCIYGLFNLLCFRILYTFEYFALTSMICVSMKELKESLLCSVQSFSRVQLFATPWIAARQASLVHHQLPEFTQTHVHRVRDAIQSSHPLSSPSPPAPNPFQQQSTFPWVNSSHEVAKVLEFQL